MSDLSKYAQAVRQLSREGFMRDYNHPFLLVKTDEQAAEGAFSPATQHADLGGGEFDPHRTSITHILPKTGSFAVLRHNAVNYRVHAVVPLHGQTLSPPTLSAESQEATPVAVTLGRAQDNDIVLNKTAISKHHAIIVYQVSPNAFPSRAQLKDIGSRNGTFVKGKRLVPHVEAEVDFGDAIVLGDVASSLIGAGALWEIIRQQTS